MDPFLNPTSTLYEAPLQAPSTPGYRPHSSRPRCCHLYPRCFHYAYQSHATQATDTLYTTHYGGVPDTRARCFSAYPTFSNTDHSLTQFPSVNLNPSPLYQQSRYPECSQALLPLYSTSNPHPRRASTPAIHEDDTWSRPRPRVAFYNPAASSTAPISVNGLPSTTFIPHGETMVPPLISHINRPIVVPHHPAPMPMVYQDSQPQYNGSIATGYDLPTDGWQSDTYLSTSNQHPDALHAYAAHPSNTAATTTTTTDRQMTLTPQDFEDMLPVPQGHGNDGAPPNDESLSCGICLVGPFARSHERQRHENTVHGPPRWNCLVCGKTYRRKDTMERHRREKHKNL